MSYFLLNSIKKRIRSENDQAMLKLIKKEIYSFFTAALFAIVIAVSFTTKNTHISDLLFLSLPLLALFFPIYRPAYLLGFIVGMIYTFGGILPIVAGGIMAIICYLLYILIHPLLVKIGKTTGI
jgi:hypothetical protein